MVVRLIGVDFGLKARRVSTSDFQQSSKYAI